MTNRLLIVAGVGIALFIGQPSASAQGRSDDRGGRYGGPSSSDAQQHGYEHGYRDGADQARQDRERRLPYSYRDSSYQDAMRYYDRSLGSRREFVAGYQDGFKAGYDDSYYDRGGRYGDIYGGGRGSGMPPPPPAPPGRAGSPDSSFDTGYRAGVAAGQQDQRGNVRSNYRGGDMYRRGDANYQDGFERGYQDGYGRTRYSQDGGGYFPNQGRTGAADTRDGQGPQTRTITVPANQAWTPTTIRVSQGDRLSFNASGQIQLRPNDAKDVASIAGSLTQRLAPNSPLPKALAGALIGRIDSGQAFGIGNQTSIIAPASGLLYLGVNDDVVSDNSGQFQVTISW